VSGEKEKTEAEKDHDKAKNARKAEMDNVIAQRNQLAQKEKKEKEEQEEQERKKSDSRSYSQSGLSNSNTGNHTDSKSKIKDLVSFFENEPSKQKKDSANTGQKTRSTEVRGTSHHNTHTTINYPKTPLPTGPQTPTTPLADRTNNPLEELLKYITEHPDAQIKCTLEKQNDKALTASNMTSEVAQNIGSLKPVKIAASANQEEDRDRKIYHIVPTQEGPVFMPRKIPPNNNTLKTGDPLKIVYDMVWYKKGTNDEFEVDASKSFIAPDGHPAGSRASVPFAIRKKCEKYHTEKFASKSKTTPMVTSSIVDSLSANMTASTNTPSESIPPAPPLPKCLSGQSITSSLRGA
jgi:hypothetical protein